MSKWIVAVLFTALVLMSGAAAAGSAHGSATSSAHGSNGRKATRTPIYTATSTSTRTPTYTPGPTNTPTPDVRGPQREQETVNLINQRRAALGLGTLRVDSALTTAARRHSYDIGPSGLCQHNGTDGSSPWSRIADAGYTGSPTGEIVGCGFASSQAVVDAWWASPAHYAILTDATANDIGCGWWVNSSGYGWATCDLGWTVR